MCAYYTQIVRAVQPQGPYDLGGYSLGGVLVYEVTRQLQELGQTITTMTMLDSLDSAELKNIDIYWSYKTMLLQTVNMALGTINQAEPETFSEKLIHRDALDLDTDDETFVRNLVEMAEERGMIRTQAQLQELIEQCSKVQQAYELTRFGVQPLTHPDQVTCYYFRNGSGLLLGQLEPYFKLPIDDVISVDHVNYWSEWEAEIEDFQMVDVDSSNHFMLLSEPKAKKPIMKFCQELYSKEGLDNSLLSQNDLESD
jgi:thioesterase domain-containing protein